MRPAAGHRWTPPSERTSGSIRSGAYAISEVTEIDNAGPAWERQRRPRLGEEP